MNHIIYFGKKRGWLFVLFYFILLAQDISGQARIFYTESQIKAEFKNEIFKSGLTDDNKRFVYFENQDISVAYYFGSDKLCNGCRVFPKTQEIINLLVEIYNSKFMAVSDTKWKYYTDKGVIYVELIYKDDSVFFQFLPDR